MYAAAHIKSKGTACTILRAPPVPSKVLMERVSNSSDPATRDGGWKGTILADSALVSGDLFTVAADSYLTQSVTPTAGVLQWFAMKCNAVPEHWRYEETVDDDGNIIVGWNLLGTTPAWGQIVTANLRAADPGLLDAARYLFQVPKVLGVLVLDRFVYSGHPYQVDSLDDIAMAGVVRLQLAQDVRG